MDSKKYYEDTIIDLRFWRDAIAFSISVFAIIFIAIILLGE